MPSSSSRWHVVVNSRCKSSGGGKGWSAKGFTVPQATDARLGQLTGFFLFPRLFPCYAGIVKSSKAERVMEDDNHVLVPSLCPRAGDHGGLRSWVRHVHQAGSRWNRPTTPLRRPQQKPIRKGQGSLPCEQLENNPEVPTPRSRHLCTPHPRARLHLRTSAALHFWHMPRLHTLHVTTGHHKVLRTS